jgi:hypothetical protein
MKCLSPLSFHIIQLLQPYRNNTKMSLEEKDLEAERKEDVTATCPLPISLKC